VPMKLRAAAAVRRARWAGPGMPGTLRRVRAVFETDVGDGLPGGRVLQEATAVTLVLSLYWTHSGQVTDPGTIPGANLQNPGLTNILKAGHHGHGIGNLESFHGYRRVQVGETLCIAQGLSGRSLRP
jgi:hypothetical protein